MQKISHRRGFSILEILIASAMLLSIFAVALQMISQASNRAQRARIRVYTVLMAQNQNPQVKSSTLFAIPRVPLNCQKEQNILFEAISLKLSCEAPGKPAVFQKSWPDFSTHWGIE